MKKVLFVATVVKTHIMEFHLPYLKMFREMGWETAVAARNDYDDPADCRIPYTDHYYNIPFERNPLKPGNMKAYRQLKKRIDEGNYDIIHCHTPVGAMLARLAATGARKRGTRVIYTAHGFHFYKGAPLLNWLVYYPVERFLARFTDVLITINREDHSRAKSFPVGKLCYVPGVGIDLNRFSCTEEERNETRRRLRSELGIPETAKVILSVGELNRNKNHKAGIEAVAKMQDGNAYYVVCGRGPLMDEHRKLAEQLGIGERVILAGYRTDVADFYKLADIFLFPSFREGLPVAVMEALASGLPVVATNIRGSRDLVPEGPLFAPTDTEGMAKALDQDPGSFPKADPTPFDINHIMETMKAIYGV